jgi:hypothetical protein
MRHWRGLAILLAVGVAIALGIVAAPQYSEAQEERRPLEHHLRIELVPTEDQMTSFLCITDDAGGLWCVEWAEVE